MFENEESRIQFHQDFVCQKKEKGKQKRKREKYQTVRVFFLQRDLSISEEKKYLQTGTNIPPISNFLKSCNRKPIVGMLWSPSYPQLVKGYVQSSHQAQETPKQAQRAEDFSLTLQICMTRPRKELISSQAIEPNFIGHLKRKPTLKGLLLIFFGLYTF